MKIDDKYEQFIEIIKSMPSVGKKVAERIFMKLVENKEFSQQMIETFKNINETFSACETCFYLQQNNVCPICNDKIRDQKKICVVANIIDAKIIESNKIYNGLYNVLKGEISIKQGITPEKLTIHELEIRVKNYRIEEVIIAINSTFDGEVTANYLNNVLNKNNKLKVTRLAQGLPIGGSLDYIDSYTLKKALQERKKI